MAAQHNAITTLPRDPLLDPVRHANPGKPFVVAQLGQSLDGRIATPTGASRWINRDCALDHLHRLRASVDAVVVGAGTVAADNPQLTVRRVRGRNPARVVIDPNGRAAHGARCLDDDGTRRIVVGTDDRSAKCGAETLVLERAGDLIDPQAIVTELYSRGLRRILVEGGARTISAFLDAGVIDRLHILVAPIILGSGIPGLALKPIDTLHEARRPATNVHVLDDGDVLFDCDLR